jgi:hypothetical protein
MMAAAALTAGAPKGFEHWTSAELQGFERSWGRRSTRKRSLHSRWRSYGNHSFLMAHREGSGEAELHETQNDVMVVESGEATLVVGGTVVDPRTTAPHEIRGPSIRGGEKWRWRPATWCTFRSRYRTRCWWRAANRSRISW